MINPVAWAQAANAEDQSFWTSEGPVTDVPSQQHVVARISYATSNGSRYAWDQLRVVHLIRAKDRRFEAVLELPQRGRDLSGRHLLVSVHALIRGYEMNPAAEALTDVLTKNEGIEVDGATPADLEWRLKRLARNETAVATWVRRKMARR